MPDNAFEIKDVENALKEMRALVEKATKDALDGAKIEKINKYLDSQEAANQNLVLAQKELKALKEDTEKRIKELETQVSRPGNGGMNESEQKAEREKNVKALTKFMVSGKESLTPEEVKYLRTDSNVDGGYLVPDEMDNTLVKKLTEISPIRSIARVRKIGSKRIEFPVRDSLVTSYWVGEGQSITSSNTTYGKEKIIAEKTGARVDITIEDLQDSMFNMETLIRDDVSESMAQLEGTAFVSGNGINRPFGFMSDTAVGNSVTGHASLLTMDSIITLAGTLKTGYGGNAVYTFNRTTSAALRLLKDGVGRYHWSPGNVAAGVPNQLNGYPYVEVPDMDDVAANAYPIAFGDFRKAYTIVDRVGLAMVRDPFTLAADGKVRFIFMRRVGGGVILPEAIKKLKVAAS